jgi:hypothetical protein
MSFKSVAVVVVLVGQERKEKMHRAFIPRAKMPACRHFRKNTVENFRIGVTGGGVGIGHRNVFWDEV